MKLCHVVRCVCQEFWTQEWRAAGLAEGRAEGQQKVLLRQAELRFGPLDPSQVERLLAADLDGLVERMLSAGSFEELVG